MIFKFDYYYKIFVLTEVGFEPSTSTLQYWSVVAERSSALDSSSGVVKFWCLEQDTLP